MLQIGQIRKNVSGTYLSPLSKYSSSVYISWYDNGQVFEDYALHRIQRSLKQKLLII